MFTGNASSLLGTMDKVQAKAKATGGGLSSAFAGGLAGGIAGAITTGLVSAVSGAIGKFGELSENISRAVDDATRLGTTADKVMGLQGAAQESGISIDELSTGLKRFRRETQGDLYENLLKFGDALDATEDPAKRAQMAFEKFGKTGVNFITLFEGGGKGLAEKVALYERLGYTLKDVDAKNVEAAGDAVDRVKMGLAGFYNQLIAGVAPAVSDIAGLVLEWLPTINAVARGIGDFVGKGLQVGVGLFRIISAQVVELFNHFAEGAGITSEWFDGWPSWGEITKGVLYGLAVGFAYVWDSVKLGQGIFEVLRGAIIESIGRIMKAVNKLVDGFNDLTGGRLTLPKFDEGVADGFTKIGGAWKATGQKMIDDFGQTHDQIDLLFADIWGKQEETAKRNTAMAAPLAYTASAAMLQGSKEAYSVEAKFKFGNVLNPQVQVQKDQLAEQKRANELAKEQSSLLRDIVRLQGNVEVI